MNIKKKVWAHVVVERSNKWFKSDKYEYQQVELLGATRIPSSEYDDYDRYEYLVLLKNGEIQTVRYIYE